MKSRDSIFRPFPLQTVDKFAFRRYNDQQQNNPPYERL